MAGVTARRLARPRREVKGAWPLYVRQAAGEPGTELAPGFGADEVAALLRVRAREQFAQRHGRGVPVPGLAVREGELRALENRVHVLDAEECTEIEALDQREL